MRVNRTTVPLAYVPWTRYPDREEPEIDIATLEATMRRLVATAAVCIVAFTTPGCSLLGFQEDPITGENEFHPEIAAVNVRKLAVVLDEVAAEYEKQGKLKESSALLEANQVVLYPLATTLDAAAEGDQASRLELLQVALDILEEGLDRFADADVRDEVDTYLIPIRVGLRFALINEESEEPDSPSE